MYENISDLLNDINTAFDSAAKKVLNKKEIQDRIIDKLIHTAVFSNTNELKTQARTLIRQIAHDLSIFPGSINALYRKFGDGSVSGFTVPAMNIRTLTYDTARTILKIAMEKNIGTFVFEIARSEIDYTQQRPDEYAVAILAAAIKEDFQGPLFIQADHFQFSAKKYALNPSEETQKIKTLTTEAITAGFYNVDIDASTLVDLTKENLDLQQKANYEVTAEMTDHIRETEPENVTISIGGEIGHIGGKNSTKEDLEAFMQGYLKHVNKEGISKVSVQTGTSHGGVPLADGTIADIKLDFSVLETIGEVARKTYGLGGPVQHGASTLPNSLFDRFVSSNTLEIHLATGFQNIVYDTMPKSLREEIYAWLKENAKDEWEKDWSEEQFLYKTRKKALGPFKEKLWNLTTQEKKPIVNALRDQFLFLFEKLHVIDTKNAVSSYVTKNNKSY